MSDCIVALIMTAVVTLCLGDDKDGCNRSSRRNNCVPDRCAPLCGGCGRRK